MIALTHKPKPPASLVSRLATLATVLVLCLVLVVARQLVPDPKGYGTHQQLGLPPCGSVLLWGAKCPACGMTTAWSYAVRGRWLDAWQANAGGCLLLAITLVYAPLFGYHALRGRWSTRGWLSLSLSACLAVALIVAVATRFEMSIF